MSGISEQLLAIADHLEVVANTADPVIDPVADALEAAADRAGKAWSGSSLGYHANVYHREMQPPPPGAHFSSEWGLMRSFAPGTSGDWCECDPDEVKKAIRSQAGDPDSTAAHEQAARCADTFRDAKSRFDSAVSLHLRDVEDTYLDGLRQEADGVRVLSFADGVRAQLPGGRLMSRDAVAVSAGLKPAPHQEILAEVAQLRTAARAVRELGRIARLAGEHISRAAQASATRRVPSGTHVFIGHGRSLQWLKLKDFVQDRLGLSWDEFNRVPVAGVANVTRLAEMLDSAAIALVIMTAEDQTVDGATRARENVVHEAGLFQGRLGFMRAIILLEEGCEEFSNIHGLGQIRFPAGRIEAAFEEVRLVIEREGLIEPGAGT